MAKYDELCMAYKESVERFAEYHDSCFQFATEFFEGMKQYMNIPKNMLEFYSVVKNDAEPQVCLLREAMHLGEDGFYLIPFSLTVLSPYGDEIIIISIKIKKSDNKFAIRLANLRKEFSVVKNEDMKPVYDCIFEEIKLYYDRDGKIFKLSVNPIGFLTRKAKG